MRSGSLTLIVVVFLGALTRVRAPQIQPNAIAGQASSTASPWIGGEQRGTRPAPKSLKQDFPAEIRRNIRNFFHQEPTPGQNCVSEAMPNWCVPLSQAGMRFVIATVPDPVHSHLSLFFDRIIEAIEQGASSMGYDFDRAVLPWSYFDRANAPETADKDRDRETFPGLMIFRHEMKPPLFVLVVGETPTAGVNEEQFNHAVEIIHAIRAAIKDQESVPEFGILGPTFSGSLYSLGVILKSPSVGKGILPVYATVMGTGSIRSFRDAAPGRVSMVIFQEDALTIQNALREFACGLRYEDKDLAVLAEDETAYGSSTSPAPSPGTSSASTSPRASDPLKPDHPLGPCLRSRPVKTEEQSTELLNLTFPREISQFRSAYSKEIPQQTATGNGNQPQQNNLRLDLEVTGRADDSIAPYAKEQTPLSQEAVMFGILSEIRRRESKMILLRATDPLDELFLARYLRKEYPQARLVVPTPDLLFASGEDGLLNGVLGLNT